MFDSVGPIRDALYLRAAFGAQKASPCQLPVSDWFKYYKRFEVTEARSPSPSAAINFRGSRPVCCYVRITGVIKDVEKDTCVKV